MRLQACLSAVPHPKHHRTKRTVGNHAGHNCRRAISVCALLLACTSSASALVQGDLPVVPRECGGGEDCGLSSQAVGVGPKRVAEIGCVCFFEIH